MFVKSMSITSYASFKETGTIELGRGINIFVGQNNSGKSALIQSLSSLRDNPHRNEEQFRSERLSTPEQKIKLSLSGSEFETIWLQSGGDLYWPVTGNNQQDIEHAHDAVAQLLANPEATVDLTRLPQGEFQADQDHAQIVMAFGLTGGGLVGHGIVSGPNPNLAYYLTRLWRKSLFSFNAQRYSVGRSPMAAPDILSADANNLPAVLMRTQGNRGALFSQLVQHMRDIFPSVGNISVTSPPGSSELEIRVWPTPEQRFVELSVGLDESGTGLSQVLSILTVVMTMENSIIVIDEMSSFLHPAAAKALIRILESHYPEHQYIVSTHSPEIISASNPSSVHLVRKSGFKSTVTQVNMGDIGAIREVASELGVTMTDVFAADRVVWVEGPTEEKSFAYIFEKMRPDTNDERSKPSPQFTAVVATGDFASKKQRPEMILDIYGKLTRAAAPLNVAATFAFDREKLTDDEVIDLKKRAHGKLMLLPRRLFECYIVFPASISAILNEDMGGEPTSASMIEDMLLAMGSEPRYQAAQQWNGDLYAEGWLELVDAAKLLKDVFDSASTATVSFSKTNHSFRIMRHALDNNPAALQPLTDFVRELVELSRRQEQ